MANNASLSGLSIDLTELSVDTTPQLGGNLDLNSNNINGTGNINVNGTITGQAITSNNSVTASTFSGSGASLTNLNASNLASGTIPDARFPSALPAIDGSNLTGINTDLVSDTTPQLGGDLDGQGNDIDLSTGKIQFGSAMSSGSYVGSELEIYKSSYGNIIRSMEDVLQVTHGDSSYFRINNGVFASGYKEAAKFDSFAECSLRYDGNLKLATTNTGVDITGNLTTTGSITPGSYRAGEII